MDNFKLRKLNKYDFLAGLVIFGIFFFFISSVGASPYTDDMESYNIGSTTEDIWGAVGGATGYCTTTQTGYLNTKGFECINATTSAKYLTDITHTFATTDKQCFRVKMDNVAINLIFHDGVNDNFGIDITASGGTNNVRYYGSSTDLFLVTDNQWVDICTNFNSTLDKYNICLKGAGNENYSCSRATDYLLPGTTIDSFSIEFRTFSDPDRSFWFDNLFGEETTSDFINVVNAVEGDEDLNIGSEYYITALPRYCTTGLDCDMTLLYNWDAIGDVAEIYLSDISGTVGALYATSSLIEQPLLRSNIPLSIENNPIHNYYCVGTENTMGIECGILINWMTADELCGFTDYDIESACDDMDDTASTTFMYGVECGLRKFGYWMMTPNDCSYLDLSNALLVAQQNFPLSVYYDSKVMFEVMRDATTTNLDIPLVWYEQSTGWEDLGSLEVSSSTIINTPGMTKEKYDLFFGAMEFIIYFYGFIWVVMQLVNRNRAEQIEV